MATAIKQYNFPEIIKGTTFNGLEITGISINDVALDISGYSIELRLSSYSYERIEKKMTVGDGITITNAAVGAFTINSFKM